MSQVPKLVDQKEGGTPYGGREKCRVGSSGDIGVRPGCGNREGGEGIGEFWFWDGGDEPIC